MLSCIFCNTTVWGFFSACKFQLTGNSSVVCSSTGNRIKLETCTIRR